MKATHSGDEDCGDEITSGLWECYEGELDQNDLEREMEDAEDGI